MRETHRCAPVDSMGPRHGRHQGRPLMTESSEASARRNSVYEETFLCQGACTHHNGCGLVSASPICSRQNQFRHGLVTRQVAEWQVRESSPEWKMSCDVSSTTSCTSKRTNSPVVTSYYSNGFGCVHKPSGCLRPSADDFLVSSHGSAISLGDSL